MSNSVLALDRPALLVIDVQKGFDDVKYWGRRNNPECEDNIRALLTYWRSRKWPVIYVRHDSTIDGSPLSPAESGNRFKDVVHGTPDLLVRKRVNSAFYGSPDLNSWLRCEGISQLVICGITTNHCCETTARMAGNLGFDTYFAADATHTFDRFGPDGVLISAEMLSAVTATNLHGAFATVVSTARLLTDTGRDS